jgi:cytochrome c oxidase subunit II
MKGSCGKLGLIVAGVLLGGCNDVQSVLAPQGPAAAEIAQLSWILFAFGTVVLIVVVIACWLAIRGSEAARARLAASTSVIIGGIAFPALTLTALLGFGVWLTQASVQRSGIGSAIRIEVVGEQWWWRVSYVGLDGRPIASANEIRIPAGRPVDFVLTSADVIHSFWVPNLGGKVDMIPGRTTHLRLAAERPGIFRGQCAEYCGGPHALMALEVVAMSMDDFSAWLAAQSMPATDPATPEAERGKALFLAAGCGGCHTVRGTEATGSVGPDLTHIGSRRSVGIDTLPVTQASLSRFIVDGQHVKPSNRMPPFGIFGDEELGALTSYLESLR